MNNPDQAMPEFVEWESLTEEWLKKKLAMIEAETELDAQVAAFLERKGARPLQTTIDQVAQCRQEEYEARGQLDQFISELP